MINKIDCMNRKYHFIVAEHYFSLVLPEQVDLFQLIPSLAPFQLESDDPRLLETPAIFTLHVGAADGQEGCLPADLKYQVEDVPKEAESLITFDWDEADAQIFRSPDFYYVKMQPKASTYQYTLRLSSSYEVGVTALSGDAIMDGFAINNFLMMIYTFSTAHLKTLLMHSSVAMHDGYAYMFLGKSGTGKSTHSRLWLTHIPDTDLLNDDNPIVRIIDHEAWVYGSPWSGKTPCYRNLSLPLGAVVRLSQAPYNKITQDDVVQSFASLMPSCSVLRQDKCMLNNLKATLIELAQKQLTYSLECLPDEAAARLCYATVHHPTK